MDKFCRISVPDGLPAITVLAQEGVEGVTGASDGGLRPVRLLLINLMPEKIPAETDWIRLLASAGIEEEISLSLARMGSHVSRHTAPEHIERFYTVPDSAMLEGFDGVIMNGAPLEKVHFPDTDYWDEACGVMDSTWRLGIPVMYVCWGAFAALYHRHGIDKPLREVKLSGVYRHALTPDGLASPLGKGLEKGFYMPHSRYCVLEEDKIPAAVQEAPQLKVIAEGEHGAGPAVFSDSGCDMYFTGHPEYATQTLGNEYHRDLGKGMNPHIPENYYPGDNPALAPLDPPLWREGASALMRNWLVNFVKPRHEKRQHTHS